MRYRKLLAFASLFILTVLMALATARAQHTLSKLVSGLPFSLPSVLAQTNSPAAAPSAMSAPLFNYGEALQKSLLFYEAQRSGTLPPNHRISWRGNSALQDGSDVGLDLTGGYFDAGDHVKFGLPLASSLTLLSWGVIQYHQAYVKSGQLDEVLDAIRWGTDYLVKCHVVGTDGKTQELWAQVGDGAVDHAYWGPAEQMTMPRPAFKIDRDNPGSDLAGETAAALAAASIAFRSTDQAYADRLLSHALPLFEFAEQYRGKYSDSIPAVQQYYTSFNGYNDELVWSAIWIYKALKARGRINADYLTFAETHFKQTIGQVGRWTNSWDNKTPGAVLLLAQETDNIEYRQLVENWLNFWVFSDHEGKRVASTPAGLAWLTEWASLRYAANTAFLAFVYTDTLTDPSLQGSDRYLPFAEGQINYILGKNPRKFSYMVGFGSNFPRSPHHRGASGRPTVQDPRPNRHILYGALVGGPTAADDNAYRDDRTNYQANEVALDYNAGLTGALARMYQKYGGTPLTNQQLSRQPGIRVR